MGGMSTATRPGGIRTPSPSASRTAGCGPVCPQATVRATHWNPAASERRSTSGEG
ncbi:hypothetical protein M2167_005366 [Streptomyces sp. SPB4]|nr:hypothetical protein [Streptomyces sp. SPB4]